MKQATQDRIDKIVTLVGIYAPDLDAETLADFAGIVRLTILEQDRDTRHACADAVTELPHEEGLLISASRAYAACMNVQAI